MKKLCLIAALAFAFGTLTASESAGNWPGFRGPNASGVTESSAAPLEIGPDKNVRWKIEVPWSPSSPCVWGDRLFLTTFAAGKLETRAYSAADGKLLWTRVAPAEKLEDFHQTDGSPAAATPVTDGKRVISYFGSYGLVCHDFDGKEIWKRPLKVIETWGGFGSGGSPLLAKGLVIVNRDQAHGSTLSAFHAADGKPAWEVAREDGSSFGTPILWAHDGIDEVVMAGSILMKAYDLKTGEERWRMRGLPSCTCTTPVLGGGMLYFAGWAPGKSDSPFPTWETALRQQDKNGDGVLTVDEYLQGPAWFKSQDINGNGKIEKEDWDTIAKLLKAGNNGLIAVKAGGKGDVTESHLAWRFDRGLPYVPSPLFYDGKVYIVKDGGMVSCVDGASGKPVYVQERLKALGSYYASPVAAAGRIYFISVDGRLSVIKAGGDKPEILHEANFGERVAATPAIAGGHLYLRTQGKLYSF